MRRPIRNGERGVSAIEYAVIAAGVAVTIISVVFVLGGNLSNVLGHLPGIAVPSAVPSNGGGDENGNPPVDRMEVPLPYAWLPPSWANVPTGDPGTGRFALAGDPSVLSGISSSAPAGCSGTGTIVATQSGSVPSLTGIGNVWRTDSVSLGPDPCQFTLSWSTAWNVYGIDSPSGINSYGAVMCRSGDVVAVARVGNASGGRTGSQTYQMNQSINVGAMPCTDAGGIVAVGTGGRYSSATEWQSSWAYLTGTTTEITCEDIVTGQSITATQTSLGSESASAPSCPAGTTPVRIAVTTQPGGQALDASINSADTTYWMEVSSMYTQTQLTEDQATGACGLVLPNSGPVALQASDCDAARSEGLFG